MPNPVATRLYYRKSSATYSITLYDAPNTTGAGVMGNIGFTVAGVPRYVPLGALNHDLASNLRVREGGITLAVLTSQPLPVNMIIPYSDITAIRSGFACNGLNGTPGLMASSYPTSILAALTSLLTVGGTTAHAASVHSASTPTVGYAINPSGFELDGLKYQYYLSPNETTHIHTVASHSHTASGSNFGKGVFGSIPWMFGHQLYANAICLSQSAISHAAITAWSAYYGYLLGFGTWDGTNLSVVARAFESHTHGAVSLTSSAKVYTTPRVAFAAWENNLTHWLSHSHTSSHEDGSSSPEPYSRQAMTYKASAPLTMDSLPSGSLGLFTTTTLPSGWTSYDPGSRFMALGSSHLDLGSDSHTHNRNFTLDDYPASYVGSVANEGYSCDLYVAGSFRTVANPHTHQVTGDSHTMTTIDDTSKPPYVRLQIGVKS